LIKRHKISIQDIKKELSNEKCKETVTYHQVYKALKYLELLGVVETINYKPIIVKALVPREILYYLTDSWRKLEEYLERKNG